MSDDEVEYDPSVPEGKKEDRPSVPDGKKKDRKRGTGDADPGPPRKQARTTVPPVDIVNKAFRRDFENLELFKTRSTTATATIPDFTPDQADVVAKLIGVDGLRENLGRYIVEAEALVLRTSPESMFFQQKKRSKKIYSPRMFVWTLLRAGILLDPKRRTATTMVLLAAVMHLTDVGAQSVNPKISKTAAAEAGYTVRGALLELKMEETPLMRLPTTKESYPVFNLSDLDDYAHLYKQASTHTQDLIKNNIQNTLKSYDANAVKRSIQQEVKYDSEIKWAGLLSTDVGEKTHYVYRSLVEILSETADPPKPMQDVYNTLREAIIYVGALTTGAPDYAKNGISDLALYSALGDLSFEVIAAGSVRDQINEHLFSVFGDHATTMIKAVDKEFVGLYSDFSDEVNNALRVLEEGKTDDALPVLEEGETEALRVLEEEAAREVLKSELGQHVTKDDIFRFDDTFSRVFYDKFERKLPFTDTFAAELAELSPNSTTIPRDSMYALETFPDPDLDERFDQNGKLIAPPLTFDEERQVRVDLQDDKANIADYIKRLRLKIGIAPETFLNLEHINQDDLDAKLAPGRIDVQWVIDNLVPVLKLDDFINQLRHLKAQDPTIVFYTDETGALAQEDKEDEPVYQNADQESSEEANFSSSDDESYSSAEETSDSSSYDSSPDEEEAAARPKPVPSIRQTVFNHKLPKDFPIQTFENYRITGKFAPITKATMIKSIPVFARAIEEDKQLINEGNNAYTDFALSLYLYDKYKDTFRQLKAIRKDVRQSKKKDLWDVFTAQMLPSQPVDDIEVTVIQNVVKEFIGDVKQKKEQAEMSVQIARSKYLDKRVEDGFRYYAPPTYVDDMTVYRIVAVPRGKTVKEIPTVIEDIEEKFQSVENYRTAVPLADQTVEKVLISIEFRIDDADLRWLMTQKDQKPDETTAHEIIADAVSCDPSYISRIMALSQTRYTNINHGADDSYQNRWPTLRTIHLFPSLRIAICRHFAPKKKIELAALAGTPTPTAMARLLSGLSIHDRVSLL